MSEYTARVRWERGAQNFTDARYSRAHVWTFDGGIDVPASASPAIVAAPLSESCAIDPEEAFVASLASCHMLTFLALAAKAGFRVDSYDDLALGVLEKNGAGRLAITRVRLRPRVVFSGSALPMAETARALHEKAHEECFLANSVRTDVLVEPADMPETA